jgi:excisionase family DNA binding protein
MHPKTETPASTEQHASLASSRFPAADRLLTIKEVAELTGLAVGTLYHFVSQKRIPVVRLSTRCIRFRQSDLSDWIQTLSHEIR